MFESNKPARIPNAMEATDRISWIKPLTKQRAASIITIPLKTQSIVLMQIPLPILPSLLEGAELYIPLIILDFG